MCPILLKHLFLLPHLLWNVEFEFSWSHNTKQSSEILILKIEMLLEFQNKTNIEIIGFSLMHFRFALELSDIDLWNTDLLDTHLDLIGTDTPNKYIVCLHNLFKTSSKHVFKTSSRHLQDMSSRHLQDMSSGCLQDMAWRCLQRNNFSSSKTFWRKIVTLKRCWRRLQHQQLFVG